MKGPKRQLDPQLCSLTEHIFVHEEIYAAILPTHSLHDTNSFYKTPSHGAEENSAAVICTLKNTTGDSRDWSSSAMPLLLSDSFKRLSSNLEIRRDLNFSKGKIGQNWTKATKKSKCHI